MPGESDTYVLRPPQDRPAQFQIDYHGLLNEAQYEAVTSLEGPLLLVAGAGTGKTRTLVFRVARLVESGVDPHRILLLTFTRKAAGEMLRRASRLLDGRCDHVSGGTFHSFANTILRRHANSLGLANSFTILDRGDTEDIIQFVRAEMGLDNKDKRFPKKRTIGRMYGMAVNKSLDLADVIEKEYPHLKDHTEDLLKLRKRYQAYKTERQLLDYDDLLVKLYELLDQHEEVRKHLSDAYRFIMVDEYQDTNTLQARIIRLLTATHDNVMAVGDDAQSIYAFRGANFRNIMEFPKLFPGTRIIPLEENYRSTQPILNAANAVISQAVEGYTKTLFTRQGDGETPCLVAAYDENYQSRFVCQRILELCEEGIPLDDIAVLFRSSFHSFDLELELPRHDIPFIKRGGFKFIETAHIKDTVVHLRVVANPLDSVSWHRLLLLIEGIGPRGAQRIIEGMARADDIPAYIENSRCRGSAAELSALAGLFRRMAATDPAPASQLSEVLRYYEPLLKRKYRDDHPKRLRDLEHFQAIAERYSTVGALLTDMALEPPTDSADHVLAAADEDGGRLTLSTIHSAKGLEWQAVFILWAVEGRFPSVQSMNSPDQIEEERRLLYVAATRAKRHLYVTYPLNIYDRAAGLTFSRPSRFLDGIPRETLRPMQLVEE